MKSHGKVVFTLFAVVGLSIALFASGVASEPQDVKQQGTNVQAPPKDAQDNAKSKALHDLELAGRLISYGRQEKNAESLLLAAQILHKTPTEMMKSGFTIEGSKGDPVKTPLWTKGASELVAEAKKMGSGITSMRSCKSPRRFFRKPLAAPPEARLSTLSRSFLAKPSIGTRSISAATNGRKSTFMSASTAACRWRSSTRTATSLTGTMCPAISTNASGIRSGPVLSAFA